MLQSLLTFIKHKHTVNVQNDDHQRLDADCKRMLMLTCCPGHASKEVPARPRPARDYAARLAGDVKKALTGAKKAEAAAAEAAAQVCEEHHPPPVQTPFCPCRGARC